MGLVPFQKSRERGGLSLHRVRVQQEGSVRKPHYDGLWSRDRIRQHLDRGLPAPRAVRNKCLLFKAPAYSILLQQPRLT